MGVDPEEEPTQKSHLGDEIFADDEMQHLLNGTQAEVNTLFADEWGVWVTGLAPIRNAEGNIVATTSADPPRSPRPRTRRCAATAARPSPPCSRPRPCA